MRLEGRGNVAGLFLGVPQRFEGALAEAYDKKAPNALAEHAYRLSQAFSKFYAACPIMMSEPAVRASRLTLATATLRQLELALDLLGIATPERM